MDVQIDSAERSFNGVTNIVFCVKVQSKDCSSSASDEMLFSGAGFKVPFGPRQRVPERPPTPPPHRLVSQSPVTQPISAPTTDFFTNNDQVNATPTSGSPASAFTDGQLDELTSDYDEYDTDPSVSPGRAGPGTSAPKTEKRLNKKIRSNQRRPKLKRDFDEDGVFVDYTRRDRQRERRQLQELELRDHFYGTDDDHYANSKPRFGLGRKLKGEKSTGTKDNDIFTSKGKKSNKDSSSSKASSSEQQQQDAVALTEEQLTGLQLILLAAQEESNNIMTSDLEEEAEQVFEEMDVPGLLKNSRKGAARKSSNESKGKGGGSKSRSVPNEGNGGSTETPIPSPSPTACIPGYAPTTVQDAFDDPANIFDASIGSSSKGSSRSSGKGSKTRSRSVVGEDTNESDGLTPNMFCCETPFATMRAPSEAEFEADLNEVVNSVLNGGLPPPPNEDGLGQFKNLISVTEAQQVACSDHKEEFMSIFIIQFYGDQNQVTEAEFAILEEAVKNVYNGQQDLQCDGPFFREIDDVSLVSVAPSRTQGVFFYGFQVTGTCRGVGCSGDIGNMQTFFDPELLRRKLTVEDRKGSFLQNGHPIGRRLIGLPEDACLCPLFDTQFGPPPIDEFEDLYAITVDYFRRLGMLSNIVASGDVAEFLMEPTTQPTVSVLPTFNPTDAPIAVTPEPTTPPTTASVGSPSVTPTIETPPPTPGILTQPPTPRPTRTPLPTPTPGTPTQNPTPAAAGTPRPTQGAAPIPIVESPRPTRTPPPTPIPGNPTQSPTVSEAPSSLPTSGTSAPTEFPSGSASPTTAEQRSSIPSSFPSQTLSAVPSGAPSRVVLAPTSSEQPSARSATSSSPSVSTGPRYVQERKAIFALFYIPMISKHLFSSLSTVSVLVQVLQILQQDLASPQCHYVRLMNHQL